MLIKSQLRSRKNHYLIDLNYLDIEDAVERILMYSRNVTQIQLNSFKFTKNQIKFTNKRGDAKNVPFSSSYNVTESDTTKKFNSFDVRNVFLRFHDFHYSLVEF